MQRIRWSAICKKDRTWAISEIERIIQDHGYLLDFHRFSDLNMSFSFLVRKKKLQNLFTDFNNLLLFHEKFTFEGGSDKEMLVLLSVTFSTGTGDLTFVVPEIP